MSSALIWAQRRRVGGVVTSGPVLAGVMIAGAGWVAASAWPTVQAMTLVNWLAQVFIICAGVCVAVALTGDPLIELHESTSTPFRTVQLIRAGLVTVSGIVGAVIMFVPLHLFHVWPNDEGWITLLSPVGAVVFIAVIATTAAAFTGTTSATTIAVVAAWMFLAMLWDPYVRSLVTQRGVPLAVAVVLVFVTWRRLGGAERNIAKVATV